MSFEPKYSNELNRILDFMSTTLVEDNPTTEIGIEYFLLSVLENPDCIAYKVLNTYLSSIILDTIHKSYYEVVHNKSLTAIKPNRKISYSYELTDFLLKANYERELLNDEKITSEHVILSFLNPINNDNKIKQFFSTTALTYDILKKKILEMRNTSKEEKIKNDNSTNEDNKAFILSNVMKNSKAKTNSINTYCIDLNQLAKKGKIDKLIGRDKEINQLFKILGCRNKNNAILIGDNGVGKCLAKGTKILMYDGTFKNVEDIVIGDSLMGIDSKPRKVLNLGHGYDTMYTIRQKNGIAYTVNSQHILSLKDKHNCTFNINIQDYLKLTENEKKELKGYKPAIIAFNSKPTSENPYIIGTMLVDNIPPIYLINDLKKRFELLSGIIDTIGKKIKNGFKIVPNSKSLFNDIIFLCNSMGLLVKPHKKSIDIFGGKKISLEHLSLHNFDLLHIKKLYFNTEMEILEVKAIGDGEYFGFVIDGDKLFMLSDLTVTHNTHICEGLANLIESKNVPDFLLNKKILLLDIPSMIAGTQFRGMFEDRMKNLIDELKASNNYIVFIDDIHNIISDKSKNDIDLQGMLTSILNDGNIQIIATTSFKDYKNTFESNQNLARRFQKIIIDSPSINETIDILNNIKFYYEKYHKVRYTDSAIKACVELANKYISERNLPDSAIDILDSSGSANSSLINMPDDIKSIKDELNKLTLKKENAFKKDDFNTIDKIELKENELKANLFELKTKHKNDLITIDENDILKTISDKTNIPLSKLDANDKRKLLNIDSVLKKYIVGQDTAIDHVCRIIKRNRIGLSRHNKTLGNIFMLGSSGCGKTLLAKKLAEEIFGDEKYLVRFDMSEYSDKTSVNKLIGSNPGYVGYDNGGQLTEAVKNKKYCVLLLDEIEKADSEVYNIFLQLFDEGFLTDNTGQKVDFRNVIVLLTSNIGTKEANEMGKGIGLLNNSNENKRNIIEKSLKRKFPPEFINRLDDIIYFNTLTDDNLKTIIDIELKNLNDRLLSLNYSILYNNDIINYILKIISKNKEYGARPIIRAIQDEIENKITDLLLSNNYENNHVFNIEISNDNLIIK